VADIGYMEFRQVFDFDLNLIFVCCHLPGFQSLCASFKPEPSHQLQQKAERRENEERRFLLSAGCSC